MPLVSPLSLAMGSPGGARLGELDRDLGVPTWMKVESCHRGQHRLSVLARQRWGQVCSSIARWSSLPALQCFAFAMSPNNEALVSAHGTASQHVMRVDAVGDPPHSSVVSAMEARAGLVPASVFKTDEALREQRLGGFDSHAFPPY
jgi:hypothetical protein